MKAERTLGLIKPDATKRNLVGQILAVIESENFKLKKLKIFRLTKTQAEEFYDEHKGRVFFDELVDYMTSGDIVAFVLEKEAAVTSYRELIGDTDPALSKHGTLRHIFAKSKNENSVHGSDSLFASSREIDLIFGSEL